MNLAHNKSELERRVHAVIAKYAERGLRSLAVAYQVMLASLLKSVASSVNYLFFHLMLFRMLNIY